MSQQTGRPNSDLESEKSELVSNLTTPSKLNKQILHIESKLNDTCNELRTLKRIQNKQFSQVRESMIKQMGEAINSDEEKMSEVHEELTLAKEHALSLLYTFVENHGKEIAEDAIRSAMKRGPEAHIFSDLKQYLERLSEITVNDRGSEQTVFLERSNVNNTLSPGETPRTNDSGRDPGVGL